MEVSSIHFDNNHCTQDLIEFIAIRHNFDNLYKNEWSEKKLNEKMNAKMLISPFLELKTRNNPQFEFKKQSVISIFIFANLQNFLLKKP